jgi:hypothetical protein
MFHKKLKFEVKILVIILLLNVKKWIEFYNSVTAYVSHKSHLTMILIDQNM